MAEVHDVALGACGLVEDLVRALLDRRVVAEQDGRVHVALGGRTQHT
jgi:hypothetical protein